jgi:hypothetical protein
LEVLEAEKCKIEEDEAVIGLESTLLAMVRAAALRAAMMMNRRLCYKSTSIQIFKAQKGQFTSIFIERSGNQLIFCIEDEVGREKMAVAL